MEIRLLEFVICLDHSPKKAMVRPIFNGRKYESLKSWIFIFRFKINIEGMNDTEDKILEEGASNGATVAIICIVLVVLALILSGALTFYAKKQNIWCFKGAEEDISTKPNIDPEMQRPLQNTEFNEAPIIKPGLRRPQTTQA